ncbi:CHC2 zinc finger domain-containing protein [Candidatus Vidania fulgoroideorum]
MKNFLNKIKKLLKIKKIKKRYWALCPFHKEKNESFLINKKEKYYYCFGCKNSGNIDYLIKYLKKKKNNFFLEKIYKNLKNKNKNFINNYLLKRGFDSKSLIKKFLINSNKVNFKKFFKKKEIKSLLLKKILIIKRKKIVFYENSIIIPIKDQNGYLLSFAINNKFGKPKYFFSRNFYKFNKKNIIFGFYELFKNKFYNKNEIFVVEGFFDFFRLYDIGIKNSVCIMGSDLSLKQFFILEKTKKKIVFIMDCDLAGFSFYYNLLNKKYYFNYNLLNKIFYLKINRSDPDLFFKNFKKKDFKKFYKFNKINIFEFIFLNIEYFLKKKILKIIFKYKKKIIKKIRYNKLISFYNKIKHENL